MSADIDFVTISRLLDQITPSHPMCVDDSIAIWNLVKPMVQDPYRLDIMHDKTAIHVRVYDGRGLMVLERALVADGQPPGIASALSRMARR